MNYRHAFHAGNFADVVKHVTLTRILLHLRSKPAPFRVIDTHAGTGVYDLSGPEATRSGEWRDGIARVMEASFKPGIAALIAPYLDAVRGINVSATLSRYPGSPSLVAAFLRENDRLIACELEPKAVATLTHHMRRDKRTKVIAIDGWTALAAYIPPKERRGLVLIDPPFEEPREYERLADALAAAYRKWPGGIYLAWYPVKDARDSSALAGRLAKIGFAKALRAEINIAHPQSTGLRGSGLVVVNPPWTLESELASILPALAEVFGGRSGSSVVQIIGPASR